MLELGAHMSIAGGHELAIERAEALAMVACQIFTKNANQWHAKAIDPAAAERFRERWAASPVREFIAHDSYLINLASPDDALREKSRLAFRDELDRCQLLGVPALVTHPGGHMGDGIEAGVARVAVCFDTCHAFAAGYEIRDRPGYEATMAAFDATIGLERLRAFHLNDSKKGLGSKVDRHAGIGDGELGTAAFGFVLTDPRFAGLPGILETPKGDDGEEDRRNLTTLRALASETAPATLVGAAS